MRRSLTVLSFIEFLTTLSYKSLFSVWFAVVIVFGSVYAVLSHFIPEHGLTTISNQPPLLQLLNSLYFSLVTASSVGYGDIAPLGISRLFAGLESFLALCGIGIFVSKISSARQDLSLQEVHKVTFDNISRQIREELFILRRDFDLMLEEAKDGSLTEKSWQNLLTACHVAEMRMEDIPQLYNAPEMYVIDEKRERLLVDGILRTLKQITQVIDAARATKGWKSHKEQTHELASLQKSVTELLPKWKTQSPHKKNSAAFDEIKKQALVIKKHLA